MLTSATLFGASWNRCNPCVGGWRHSVAVGDTPNRTTPRQPATSRRGIGVSGVGGALGGPVGSPAVEVLLTGLILVVLLVVAVAGVVVVRSRRARSLRAEPPRRVEPPVPPEARPGAAIDVPADLLPTDLLPADVVATPETAEAVVEEATEKPSLRDRLSRARSALGGAVGAVLGRTKIDAASFDDLEEALLLADVGVGTTTALLDDLRRRVKSESISTSEQLIEALKSDL